MPDPVPTLNGEATWVYASSPADTTMTLLAVTGGSAYAPAPNVAMTVWDAFTAGTQVIDGLYDINGVALATPGTVVSDADGEVRFRGLPSLPVELWLDAGTGVRYRVIAGVSDTVAHLLARIKDLEAGTTGGGTGSWDETRIAAIETRLDELGIVDVDGLQAVVNARPPVNVDGVFDWSVLPMKRGNTPPTDTDDIWFDTSGISG